MSTEPAARSTGPATPLVVGVLSDTHSQLHPRVALLLAGVDHILHAGDVGSAEVLRRLRAIAPLTAVRGNVDIAGWADALPSRAEVELRGVRFIVAHIASRADTMGAETTGTDASEGQPVVVVSGHSHIASLEQRGNVLYLNPGSAGSRRFGRPRTLARVEVWPPKPGDSEGRPRVDAQILSVEDD